MTRRLKTPPSARRRARFQFSGCEGLERRELLSAMPHRGLAPTAQVAPSDPASAAPLASGMVKVLTDVVYSRDGSKLDVYQPAGTPPPGGWPVIVAIPGGGWRFTNKSGYGTEVAGAMGPYGYTVVGIEYAFDHPGGPSTWTANIEDVRESIRWVRRRAGGLGLNPNKVVALGDSSGAHLALLAGTLPEGPVLANGLAPDPPRGSFSGVSARPQAVVDFYGPTDLTAVYQQNPRVRGYLNSFLGGPPSRIPGRYQAASPILHVTPDDPPVFIGQGTNDRAVPFTQSIALDNALKAAGVREQLLLLNGVPHGFQFQAAHGTLAAQVAQFLDGVLNRPTRAS